MTISFDTQSASPDDICNLIKPGQVLHAAGILNTRWEEYSALHAAEQAGLDAVEWDYVADDTPGTLELIIWYPNGTRTQAIERVQALYGVEEVQVEEDLLNYRDGGVPLD